MYTLKLNHFLGGNSKLKMSFLLTKMILLVVLLLLPSQLAQGKFLGNIWRTGTEPTNFSTYWNQVTPENSGKWASCEPTRDQMDQWTWLDRTYDYAKSRGIPFKEHCLVWGNQQPGWITSLSQDEQRAEVEEWIQAVGQRYPNMDFVDVVNEPLHAPPPYKDAIGGDGSTGWDWVIWAFQTARQYCGSAKLLINEYGIENNTSDADRYITIINLLKSRGLIDGIGVQGHGLEGLSASTLQSFLDKMAATGLPIYISEFEVDNSDDNQQLQIYQRLFPVFWQHSGVQGVTLWGYVQGELWKTNAYLLRSDGTERPALTWLKSYVGGSTTTTTAASTTTTAASTTTTAASTTTSTTSASTSTSTTSASTSTTTTAASTTTTAASTSTTTTAAAGCTCTSGCNGTAITPNFTQDGSGTYCWQASSGTYINSWNLTTLNVNGTDYTNKYVFTSSLPAKINGVWYIYYNSSVAWGHFELKN